MTPWILFTVTAYAQGCIMPRSGREHTHLNPAAYGKLPEANWSVAAPPDLPFGTVLELSYRGIITRRIVHDRGRAIKGKRLDLFVEDCERARRWGKKKVWVRVVRQPLGNFLPSPRSLPPAPPSLTPLPILAIKSRSVK